LALPSILGLHLQEEIIVMDTSTKNGGLAKTAQNLADTAASTIQSGLGEAKRTVAGAADQVSGKVADIRSDSKPLINKLADSARSISEGIGEGIGNMRDAAGSASDSAVSYTKENPVKAMVIAMAAGALLVTAIRAISKSRN
jgi:ElaB/YqjD/DUF883 family membrane-anchored ribosome-binding protein